MTFVYDVYIIASIMNVIKRLPDPEVKYRLGDLVPEKVKNDVFRLVFG